MTLFSKNIQHPNLELSDSFFTKKLTISTLSIAQVLERLKCLFGCVYLENNKMPIIGFLPIQYCVHSDGVNTSFSRQNDFGYTAQFQLNNFEDFIILDPTSNSSSTVGFNLGYIGFFDYNYAANAHICTQTKQQPNAYMGRYESYLKYQNQQWIFYSREECAQTLYEQVNSLLSVEIKSSFKLLSECKARWNTQTYRNAFDTVQEYIKAGDCYQINLTQEFEAQAQGDLLHTADAFWRLTDAPYAGYLKINEFELLSCSPELFIDFEPDSKIVTRPIKGTMPRYTDSVKDQASKLSLINSKKDQAENVMIVDLLRNDLSVYAEIGSVKTPKLFEIQSFNQVHHMVSEVTATLKSAANPFKVLIAALPGGSITGAPKIRAMEIIEELEGAPRGAYCGSMGYFNHDGTGSWNILIRSIQKYQDDISIWAGGGITIASDADAEYQECFDKVEAMVNLLNTWYKPQ